MFLLRVIVWLVGVGAVIVLLIQASRGSLISHPPREQWISTYWAAGIAAAAAIGGFVLTLF